MDALAAEGAERMAERRQLHCARQGRCSGVALVAAAGVPSAVGAAVVQVFCYPGLSLETGRAARAGPSAGSGPWRRGSVVELAIGGVRGLNGGGGGKTSVFEPEDVGQGGVIVCYNAAAVDEAHAVGRRPGWDHFLDAEAQVCDRG